MSASFLLGLRNPLRLRSGCFALVLRSRGTALSAHFTRFSPRAPQSPSTSLRVLRPRATRGPQRARFWLDGVFFARDSALCALRPAFKAVALWQANVRAHGRVQPALGSRVARLAAMQAAINPPKRAENIELPYLWLRNDGGTEPDRGHSVSFSWPAYPSVGKVARTISARHALQTE
jgi:hypothetical protein